MGTAPQFTDTKEIGTLGLPPPPGIDILFSINLKIKKKDLKAQQALFVKAIIFL